MASIRVFHASMLRVLDSNLSCLLGVDMLNVYKANSIMESVVRPLARPSASLSMHNSLIISSLEDLDKYVELAVAPLNKT
jgi:hypothetical protein